MRVGISGHVAMKNPAPVVIDHKEPVQHSERQRGYGEKVHCRNGLTMVATGRLRRTFLHLSYSMTFSHLLDTRHPALRRTASGGSRSVLASYPAFAFVQVWTSPCLPLPPASEAANPAFGYDAPHLSVRATLTHEQRAAQHALTAIASVNGRVLWTRRTDAF